MKKAGHILPHVVFREVAEGRGGAKTPQPIVSLGKAWKSACEAARRHGIAYLADIFVWITDFRPIEIRANLVR